jgi:hypothetical protein
MKGDLLLKAQKASESEPHPLSAERTKFARTQLVEHEATHDQDLSCLTGDRGINLGSRKPAASIAVWVDESRNRNLRQEKKMTSARHRGPTSCVNSIWI